MDYLQIAREHLRRQAERPERHADLPDTRTAVGDVLKGCAVLLALDSTTDRVWLVTDADDAARLEKGDSFSILATIEDRDLLTELAEFEKACRSRGCQSSFDFRR